MKLVKKFFFITTILLTVCIIFSNMGRASCALVFALLFGIAGFDIGRRMGIASGGSARNGGFTVAAVGLVIGALVGNSMALAIQNITPDPTPVVEPTFTPDLITEKASSIYRLVLPTKVKSSEGWIFTIEEIKFLESLDAPKERHRPKNGIFLWLGGKISNYTDKRDCIHGHQFSLKDSIKQYQVSKEIMDVAHDIYHLDYPGFFSGQCLDYDKAIDSFLIFDVPNDAANMWLQLGDGKSQLGDMSVLMEKFIELNIDNTPKYLNFAQIRGNMDSLI